MIIKITLVAEKEYDPKHWEAALPSGTSLPANSDEYKIWTPKNIDESIMLWMKLFALYKLPNKELTLNMILLLDETNPAISPTQSQSRKRKVLNSDMKSIPKTAEELKRLLLHTAPEMK